MKQPENVEFWNNSEFFFALDISQKANAAASPNNIVKFLLEYRDIKQLGCWRILFRNTNGYWSELKHNGWEYTETVEIDKSEWVWNLINAID
jgi:hypothetical protein